MKHTNNRHFYCFASGFTLIEMLVVIVIIGVVVTLAVLSMNLLTGDRRVRMVGEQLRDGLITARQRAVLMPDILGLKITSTGYQYYHYVRNPSGFKWKILKEDVLSHADIFKQHRVFASITHLDHNDLSIDPHSIHATSKMIVLSESGDVMPFTLLLQDVEHSVAYQLQMNSAGIITLKKCLEKKS